MEKDKKLVYDEILEVLADPSVRWWVKDALKTALGRDPVDAYHDSLLVTELLKKRMDSVLFGRG